MGFSLPHIPYPPSRAHEGFWQPVTSTINWCEEDYYATIYSAEIVNTVTNLLFIYLGIKGIRNCLKYEHDGVFAVAFLGYLLVGSGSFAFHASLKYPMQLVDELSMIYTACLMNYASFSFAQSRLVRQILGGGLLFLAVFITAYYHYLQRPEFHQNAFAILTAVVLFRSMYLMEVNLRPSLKSKWGTVAKKPADNDDMTKSERMANAERDRAILKTLWIMVGMGLSIFLGGFGIWALDNQYCSTIRRWRHQVGLPWGTLLEGHGWWHIMTGIGSYFYIVWALYLRHVLQGQQDEYVLSWPSVFNFPEVVPLEVAEKKKGLKTPVNGHANGHTNGYTKGHMRNEDRKSV